MNWLSSGDVAVRDPISIAGTALVEGVIPRVCSHLKRKSEEFARSQESTSRVRKSAVRFQNDGRKVRLEVRFCPAPDNGRPF